ncbi:non-ribosomal peptide synthetase [Nocardia brasiliensis]|uniref:non-ribosomal peptide synthetase n=1 Tax=Nocardia brasiliensis TaxID=37326 RepID=UPI002453F47A|nr:non-ribosomal peptide synthetase [Nocardia brasiliensis]
MTIAEQPRAETTGPRAPSDAQRAAFAARAHRNSSETDCVDLYLELSGTVTAAALCWAAETAAAACPVLHSVFRDDTGTAQVFEASPIPALVQTCDGADAARFVAEWIGEERSRAMDISGERLYRQVIFPLGANRVGWYQRGHRLVVDEPGLLALAARVRDLLDGADSVNDSGAPFGSVERRLEHERRYREAGAWAADREYWTDTLAVALRPEPLPVPMDSRDPATPDALWAEVAASAELTRVARSCGGGAPAVLVAALAVYGTRLAMTREFVIALTAGETTVPLRITVAPQDSFGALAKQVGRELRKARRHRYIPDIDDPWTEAPLFGQWPLEVRMLPGAALDRLGTATVTAVEGEGAVLSLCLDDRAAGGWRLALPGAHRTHRDRIIRLLDVLARTSNTPLGLVGLAAPNEAGPLVGQRADTAAAAPPTTLAALFAAQAARAPEAIALTGPELTLSYADLHAASNRLARKLVRSGVGPERLVALAFEPAVEQIVALHAVTATGGAYLPLDPGQPRERHAHLLDLAQPVCVLTARRSGFVAPPRIPVLYLDEIDLADESPAPLTDAERIAPLRPENLAYVLFTSGSTGQPKGVGVTNAAVCTHLAWMQHLHGLDSTDAVLRKTALSFDVAAWEVLWPFVTGARLVLDAAAAQGEPSALARAIAENAVTTVQFTPATLAAHRLAVSAPFGSSVRRVLLAGEALTHTLAAELPAVAPGARYDNLYGPTEATVAVTRHAIGVNAVGPIPIGTPSWDSLAYVLDTCLQPVPPGIPGELYLGGAALARGYVRRPGQTAARFVADPFGGAGERLYRTGDIVRSTAAGELEFLGRSDFQVKVRGIRIELGEVEAVLAAQDSVAQAVAVVHDETASGSGRLVAYVTPAAGHRIDPDAVDQRLRESLPQYLVPAAIVVLTELPRNRSGKLDRKALPAPVFEPVAFRAPGTDTEHALAAVFAEVLGRDGIGVDESFFALGGDSIMSILLVSRARARGIAVTAQQVYEHRTVAGLAAVAETAAGADLRPLPELPGGGVGTLPLTPVIRFLIERGGDFDRFCQAMTLELPVGIDRAALVSTVAAVVDQHDMLRSRLYRDDTGEWQLTVAPPGSVDVDSLVHQVVHEDLAHADLVALATAELNAAVDRIDPATGDVVRFVWLRPQSPATPGLLVVAAHHIAVDGVSWRVLLPDFVAAWAAVAAGGTPRLPEVGTSMRAWSHALVETAHAAATVDQLPIWREIVEGPDPAFGDRPFDPHRDFANQVAHTTVELDERDTAALVTAIPGRYRARVADALLTALALAVTRWRSRRGEPERSVLLRLEGHGREQDAVPGAELSRTVGWFTSIVPARLDLSGVDLDDAFAGGPALGVALKAVKEQLRAAPHNGFGYGLLRFLNADTAAQLPHREPGEISFNYFGHITGVDVPAELAGIGWLPAPEYGRLVIRPDARRGALGAIEVDSIVLGERLVTSFGYARTLFAEDAGEELVALWRAALAALARHARDVRTQGGHTPSDFPLVRPAQSDIEVWERRYPALTDVWPVSPLQAGMLFHAMFDPGMVDVYTVQLVLSVRGTVDGPRLRAAAAAVLARHANLRTAFGFDAAGSPVQLVVAEVALPWREVQLADAPDAEAERVLDAERATPFDPARPPLLRSLLLRRGADRAQWVVTYHHLLLDGWSIPLLVREIVAEYAGFALEPPRAYRNYVEWLAEQDLSTSKQAWAAALAGVAEPTLLAGDTDLSAPSVLPLEHEFTLDESQSRAVVRLATELEVTVNTVLQAAWAILLARMTDRCDIVFGTTVSGRPADLVGVESMVGLFINTVPIRIRLRPTETAAELLRRVQLEQFALSAHHHLGLPDIVAQADAGERGLFDTLLVVETYPVDEAALRAQTAAHAGLTITGLRSREATHYPLTLTVRQTDRLHLTAGWRPDLLDQASVARLSDRLVRVLSALAANPAAAVADIDLIGAMERAQVLAQWQRSAEPVPELTLVDLFRAQVAARPDAVAVRDSSRALTYRELDRAGDVLARTLSARGVGAESLVAVGVSRSVELIVALLGVLKSGAGYVPLDLGNPARRLTFVLAETNPACVVTTDADRADLPATDVPYLLLGETDTAEAGTRHRPPRPDDLAYVLYTSGSTGQPKGVCVTHRNVVAMLRATAAVIDTGPTDVWTMFHSPAFDFSVWEMWGALAGGATLVVVAADVTRSPREFVELLARERITVLSQTPSALYSLLDSGTIALPALRHLVLGGEALDPRRLRPWFAADPAARTRVSNLYGITEATVHATQLTLTHAGSSGASGIGRGLAGLAVRVLDSRLRPAPVGAAGEIYLAGPQLARGYRSRPAATAARYVADPFGASGTRMYRTGDRARWNSDGRLEYLGRADDQVKIRGYRIEPAELEVALLEHEAVARAAVVVRTGAAGSPQLVAYVVPVHGTDPAIESLEQHVAERVPFYMRPAAIVRMATLPLTAHGKLDRAALPDPVAVPRSAQAPRTEAERVVAEIFTEVLGVDRPGVHDSFFTLGGDSIISIQLASRARAKGWHFTPRDVFDQRTVAGIAAAATAIGSDTVVPQLSELPGGGVGELPLPPVARWLTERGGFRRVHQTLTVDLPANTTLEALVGAVAAVLDRHDMLRSRLFRDDTGEWRFETTAPGTVEAAKVLRRSHFDEEPDDAATAVQLDAALGRLDPAAGVMVQFVWLDRTDPALPGRLLICAHHLVVDGVSWRILLPDLLTALAAVSNGRAPQLDPPGTSMRRWSHALVDAAYAPDRIAEVGLWQRICATPDPLLGARSLDPAIDLATQVETVAVTVDEAVTEALVRTVPGLFHAGVDEILLAAFAAALARWRRRRGQDAPVSLLRLEGHGREEQLAAGADLSRTVGWFTSLYPVRLDLGDIDVDAALAGTDETGAMIKSVKEQLRAVPDHGIGYGLLRYLNPDTAQLLPESMPGQIAFNYLGRVGERSAELFAAPAADPDPDLAAAASIEVNAIVAGAQLHAGFAYPDTLLDAGAVTELAELWVAALGAIAAYARTGPAGGHTPSDFPLVRVSGADIARWERDYGQLTDVWPLAPLQPGLYFHAMLAGRADADAVDVYNVQTVLRLRGPVDRARLRDAVGHPMRRHPNLRAAFVTDTTAAARQVIPAAVEVPWREVELASEAELTELADLDRAARFDPARPPLLRFTLARVAQSGYALLATYHHILLDGWSLPLVLRDLLAAYATGEPLPAPGGSFREYLAWHHGRDTAASARAWRRELDGIRTPTLIAAGARTHEIAVVPGTHRLTIDADTTAALGAVAASAGTTLNTVLQVAWAIQLGRRLGRDDVVFGATVSGRPAALPGVESIVGLCINTVPVRVRLVAEQSVSELLRAVQAAQAALIEHHHLGLAEIHAAAGARDTLFDTVLAYESYPIDTDQLAAVGDALFEAEVELRDAAHYPLTLTVDPKAELTIVFGYQRAVFEEAQVVEIAAQTQRLLAAVARDPHALAEELR